MDFITSLLKNETFLTVLSGTLVYALSQFLLEMFINPRKEYMRLKQQIIYVISMYCCYYSNPYNMLDETLNVRPIDEYKTASIELRKIGAQLASYIGIVPAIRFVKRKKLLEVQSSLVGLSNGLYIYKNYNPYSDNIECEKTITRILKYK